MLTQETHGWLGRKKEATRKWAAGLCLCFAPGSLLPGPHSPGVGAQGLGAAVWSLQSRAASLRAQGAWGRERKELQLQAQGLFYQVAPVREVRLKPSRP